jgi:tetratricopeptide (TPR) repeat protein
MNGGGGELVPFPFAVGAVSAADAKTAADAFFSEPAAERARRIAEFHLENPETLLAVCHRLDADIEKSPADVHRAAGDAYDYIERHTGRDTFLFDEREYYLGELAILAGTAARILTLRDEARNWLDRAETWFLLTANATGDSARVGYQRLALKMEERQFAEVIRLTAPLAESFRRGNAKELALKCRYLEGAALRETGALAEALDRFEVILEEAKAIGSTRVLGSTYVALVQLHSELGNTGEALAIVRDAAPFLQTTSNRVALSKLHCGLGLMMRTQGRPEEAMAAFRAAQAEFREIDMHADVAALHLMIADMLLESGQERQAEWEIRAALPVIDEFKMVPEGFAAMTLLRESVRRRSIDRQALRNVHGLFQD